MTEFHKLQVSPDHATPISAYVIDDDGEKRSYKFSFLNKDDDFGEPGVLAPNARHHDETDEHDIRIAASGIETYTTYDTEIEPFFDS